MDLTKQDNYFLDKLKGKQIKKDKIKDYVRVELKASEYYKEATPEELEEGVDRIIEKLNVVNKENLQWFEWLLAFGFAVVRILWPKINAIIPKIHEKTRNRKRSYAIPNNYINAYENRKSKRRNDIRVA